MKTTDKVLLTLAVFLLAFTICMTVIFCVYGSIPDTLVSCVMGASGFEALALAWIKTSKVKSGTDAAESEEEGHG